MLGYLKKELFMLKQNGKLLLLVLALFIGLSILNQSDMTFIMPFMATIISISSFSYDNYNKWDAYALTLPGGRTCTVKAKYLSSLIFIIISFLVSIICLYIISQCGVNINVRSSILELTICLFAVFLIIAIMFPIFYKLGAEKGRIALFILTFGITGLALLVSQKVHMTIPSDITNFFKNYYKIIIPILTCFFLFISYKLSKRFYSKKEF